MSQIFVFGSNLAGIHGAGAAKDAAGMGFPRGIGVGPAAGCYALPTRDCDIETLPLKIIERYVTQFRVYAADRLIYHPYIAFKVTRIGCGHAGYKNEDIAPMFAGSPSNCHFDEAWRPWLEGFGSVNYWGTR